MITRVKVLKSLCLVACAIAVSGCGGGGGGFFTSTPSTGQSGKAVMGPVRDATIFADNVVGGIPFVQDADEVWTKTNENGDFTLPSVPGYGYRLVSKGGIDRLTGQPAMQMIAPAGSKNVTPITTLVALDLTPTGEVKKKLLDLMPPGSSYDDDISVIASSAILLVVKSVEATTQSMVSAITTNASAGSQVISAHQLATTQALIMQSIAVEIAKPTVTATTLATTASLSTTMQAAASAATVDILADGGNIDIGATTATTLATTAVSASATALSVEAVANNTAIAGGEAEAFASGATDFVEAVKGAATAAATEIEVIKTPEDYTPPPISTTGATGGTGAGTGTNF